MKIDISCVPNVHNTIFRAGNEVIRLAFVGRFTINFDAAWHESNVSDIVLVTLVDVTHDQLLHLDSLLLLRLVFIVTFKVLGGLILVLLSLASLSNHVLSRTTIPRNHLTIYATANKDLGILRGELDS